MKILLKRSNKIYWGKLLKMSNELRLYGLYVERRRGFFAVSHRKGRAVKFSTAEKAFRYLQKRELNELAFSLSLGGK